MPSMRKLQPCAGGHAGLLAHSSVDSTYLACSKPWVQVSVQKREREKEGQKEEGRRKRERKKGGDSSKQDSPPQMMQRDMYTVNLQLLSPGPTLWEYFKGLLL